MVETLSWKLNHLHQSKQEVRGLAHCVTQENCKSAEQLWMSKNIVRQVCLRMQLLHHQHSNSRSLVMHMQVIAPRVKAYLYTWGEPRFTHEGERVPAKIEDLDIGYIDGMLLLPLVEEHNIDERSPLCGHSHESLVQVGPPVGSLSRTIDLS